MRTVNIGLLGAGTIGRGVYRAIGANAGLIAQRSGLELRLAAVCDKDAGALKALDIPGGGPVTTSEAQELIDDKDIDIVVELIGGLEPARAIVLAALKAGKHVVTANKALLSGHGQELFAVAAESGVCLKFEASVCGAIPVIKALQESFVANHIKAIYGILNGTTNYILSAMDEKGMSFKEALKEAQEKGFAESDPTLDITGKDSAHKLAILAFLAYGIKADPESIHVEGLEQLTPYDISLARELGYSIKLLAVAKEGDDGVELRVHPSLVRKAHLLSSVKGEDNAVFVEGDLFGSSLFYGKGAGSLPTASSVISDIVAVASCGEAAPTVPCVYLPKQAGKAAGIVDMADVRLSYYLRFSVIDRPGVLAGISAHLAGKDISIASVSQKERCAGESVPVVILTHDAPELSVREAIAAIDKEPYVTDSTVIIRREAEQ